MQFTFSLPLSSKRTANSLNGQRWATCEACQLLLKRTDDESLLRHLNGKKHIQRVAALAAAPAPVRILPVNLSATITASTPSLIVSDSTTGITVLSVPVPSCPISSLKPRASNSTAVTPQQLELTLGDATKIFIPPTSSASSCKQGLQDRHRLQSEGAANAEPTAATGRASHSEESSRGSPVPTDRVIITNETTASTLPPSTNASNSAPLNGSARFTASVPSRPISSLKPVTRSSSATATDAVTPQQLELTLGDANKISLSSTSSASSCKQGLQEGHRLQIEGTVDTVATVNATTATAAAAPSNSRALPSESVRLTDRQPAAPFWCKSCHHASSSQKQFDQHLASQRHRDNEAVYLRGIYEGIRYVAFAMEQAAATNSLPSSVTHHSVASFAGLPSTLPPVIDTADHSVFLDSLNHLVSTGVADVRSALVAQHQNRRWTDFLNALRAGVPSVLDYELQFEADAAEDAECFDDGADMYEGYDHFGGGDFM
jgi:hypothetical protein